MRRFASKTAHAGTTRPAPRRNQVFTLAAAVALSTVLSGCTSVSSTSHLSEPVCNATDVTSRELPSVVTINVASPAGTSIGSGEIIKDSGSILTNNHVVSPVVNGGTVSVVLSDGRSYPATIIGRDPETDLAVVKVDAGQLPPITVGASASVHIGEPVVALGAPLGLSNTVTTGIVSALNRTIQVPSDNGQTATLIAAVQTDAAINPGNSGGALLNCDGALIGVPTANATVTTGSGQTSAGNVGINFAIPVDLAIAVADEIIATGRVTHSYFGLDVTAIAPTAVNEAGAREGLYVNSVVPGGPAAQAGLQQGDIITTVDGQPATDPLQLALLSLKKNPGDTVAVTFERSGAKMQTTVTVGATP